MPADPLALIATPLGLPGSGRVRYGAAMALFREGRIGEVELEVYRIASADDSEDPAILMAERGLCLPLAGPATPEARIARLAAEAELYLATLPGPGPAEVRLGLARRAEPPILPAARRHPIVDAHLGTALGALARDRPALAGAIAEAAPHLAWIPYDAYPRAAIGEAFADGHAFASLMGEGAPYAADDFDLGLFLIAPHVLYRDHRHKAPELYAPLTGPHGWRFGPDRPLVAKAAHEPVWNDPERPHLTKVGPLPFLALFAWTRDVGEPARIVPATDWAGLEALRLES